MKKLFLNASLALVCLLSGLAQADIIYLDIQGDAKRFENTILNDMSGVNRDVLSASQMAGQSGLVVRLTTSTDVTTTSRGYQNQGNQVASFGGAAIAVYVCQTQAGALPIYLGEQNLAGVRTSSQVTNLTQKLLTATARSAAEKSLFCSTLNGNAVANGNGRENAGWNAQSNSTSIFSNRRSSYFSD